LSTATAAPKNWIRGVNARSLIKSGILAFTDIFDRELNRAFRAILTRSTGKFFPARKQEEVL